MPYVRGKTKGYKMLIRANQVRKQFNEADIQVSDAAVKLIDEVVAIEVEKMVKRCGYGNVRRLTPGLFFIALGNLVSKRD